MNLQSPAMSGGWTKSQIIGMPASWWLSFAAGEAWRTNRWAAAVATATAAKKQEGSICDFRGIEIGAQRLEFPACCGRYRWNREWSRGLEPLRAAPSLQRSLWLLPLLFVRWDHRLSCRILWHPARLPSPWHGTLAAYVVVGAARQLTALEKPWAVRQGNSQYPWRICRITPGQA